MYILTESYQSIGSAVKPPDSLFGGRGSIPPSFFFLRKKSFLDNDAAVDSNQINSQDVCAFAKIAKIKKQPEKKIKNPCGFQKTAKSFFGTCRRGTCSLCAGIPIYSFGS